MEKKYYCHFEEKERPASDFDMVYFKQCGDDRNNYERIKVTTDAVKGVLPRRIVPCALCRECLAKHRGLDKKYKKENGMTLQRYKEFIPEKL